MLKFLCHVTRIALDTLEAGLCSMGVAVIMWVLGLGIPSLRFFELETYLYIGVWAWTMIAVSYEMVRYCKERIEGSPEGEPSSL